MKVVLSREKGATVSHNTGVGRRSGLHSQEGRARDHRGQSLSLLSQKDHNRRAISCTKLAGSQTLGYQNILKRLANRTGEWRRVDVRTTDTERVKIPSTAEGPDDMTSTKQDLSLIDGGTMMMKAEGL